MASAAYAQRIQPGSKSSDFLHQIHNLEHASRNERPAIQFVQSAIKPYTSYTWRRTWVQPMYYDPRGIALWGETLSQLGHYGTSREVTSYTSLWTRWPSRVKWMKLRSRQQASRSHTLEEHFVYHSTTSWNLKSQKLIQERLLWCCIAGAP